MNRHFLVIVLCLVSEVTHAAFNDTIPEEKKLSIIRFAEGGKQRGYILWTTDSTIQFIERKYWKNELFMQRRIIPVETITGIVTKSRKKISMLDGMAMGAVGGIFLGFAIGLADCDDPDNDCSFFDRLFYGDNFRTALNLSAALGGIGAFIGIFTGGKTKARFTLNGDRNNLKKYKYTLLSY